MNHFDRSNIHPSLLLRAFECRGACCAVIHFGPMLEALNFDCLVQANTRQGVGDGIGPFILLRMKTTAYHTPHLARLKPAQRRKLLKWLTEDLLTLREAVARVRETFGIVTSHTAMSKWLQRACKPSAAAMPRLLLDVRIAKAGKGWRLTLWQHQRGINLYSFGQKLAPLQSRAATIRSGAVHLGRANGRLATKALLGPNSRPSAKPQPRNDRKGVQA